MTLAGATATSVITLATTVTGTAATLPLTSDRAEIVGVAIGGPLGLALLGLVAMLWRQKKEAAKLRKEKEDWEVKYTTLLQSKSETYRSGINVPHTFSGSITRYELGEATIGELPEAAIEELPS